MKITIELDLESSQDLRGYNALVTARNDINDTITLPRHEVESIVYDLQSALHAEDGRTRIDLKSRYDTHYRLVFEKLRPIRQRRRTYE